MEHMTPTEVTNEQLDRVEDLVADKAQTIGFLVSEVFPGAWSTDKVLRATLEAALSLYPGRFFRVPFGKWGSNAAGPKRPQRLQTRRGASGEYDCSENYDFRGGW